MNKIDLDNFEPGLVAGQAGEMATIDGKRYFLPCRMGDRGAGVQHRAGTDGVWHGQPG